MNSSWSKKPECHDLALCVIVKDEERYIEEWVAFHFAVGVQFILIVDNGSSKSLSRQLAGYISEGRLEIRAFPRRVKAQREAYNRALCYLRNSKWVGFFDVDEFVYPSNAESLIDILRDFEGFPGVAVNWVTFGTSGHRESPSGWVTENFTDRGELDFVFPLEQLRVSDTAKSTQNSDSNYLPMNSHVKCFVQPRETLHFRTAHNFKFRAGRPAVNENFVPVWGPFSPEVSVGKVRVNHYWSKSLQELDEKLAKGRISQNSRHQSSGYRREEAVSRALAPSGVRDTTAQKFLVRAKEIDRQNSRLRDTHQEKRVYRLRFSPVCAMRDFQRRFHIFMRTFVAKTFSRIGWMTQRQNRL